jgi:hypothetical protein
MKTFVGTQNIDPGIISVLNALGAVNITHHSVFHPHAVNRGVAALLIDAIDVDAILPAVDDANAANIPVVAIAEVACVRERTDGLKE